MRKPAKLKKVARWLRDMGAPPHLSVTEQLDQIEEYMIQIEPLGMCVRVRDESGNVVMRAGSDGKLRAVWMRTELDAPSTAKH